MTMEQRAARIERKLLTKKPLTAGEIATRAGFETGRGISRALGYLVATGKAIRNTGRYPTYTKAA